MQAKGQRPATAKPTSEKPLDPDAQAATQSTDAGAHEQQAKKDNAGKRKSARGNKNKKPQEEGKDGPSEMRYQQKTAATPADNGPAPPTQDKKPKQQYRQKGEPKEGAPDANADNATDQKQADGPDSSQQPPKKQRQRKNNQEQRYRPKGQNAEANAAPEDGAAEGEAGEEDADGKAQKSGEKKKPGNSGAQETKNLVYQNPMEFKETKKFKSKWEEYRLGDWRKGSGKTFVTLETMIPSMPEKLLTTPDEAVFHKKLLEIEEKIKSIGQDLEDKKVEFDGKLKQKIEAQKAGEGGTAVSKDITSNFQRLGELKKQRKKIYDEQDAVASIIAELNTKRERLSKKIDRDAQKEEQLPKAIKQTQKALETQTLDNKRERELIAKIKFIKASVEFIREREVIDEDLRVRNEEKKKIGVDLPKIKKEIKELSEVVEQQKKHRDEKQENRESFEKELDKINERRKRARDERDKLYQQKYELKDEYYGALINYQKQQFLVKDINWMTEMQQKLRQKQEVKERREKEYKERQERVQKEREERTRKEEDRKKREQERRQKELENKKRMEEQLQQDEIDQLHKIIASIEDKTIGSNPFFEQIELCDKLSKYCQKQQAKSSGQAAPREGLEAAKKDKADKDRANNSDLAKAVAKGSVELAPTKESRDASGFGSLKTNKGKKGKKNNAGAGADAGGQVDFAMIKQFTSLKVSPPLGDDSYETTVAALKELSDALDYWGKILQRQKKIRHIRTSRKLKSLEEYNKMADQEEEWLKNEKQKIEDAEDDIDCTGKKISLAKIKVAQTIDKEMRLKSLWKEEDDGEDDEDESDEDRGFTAEDFGDEEDPKEDAFKDKQRKPRGGQREGPKQTQKPTAQKFKEIMKADEAFPTLDNKGSDDGSDDDGKD